MSKERNYDVSAPNRPEGIHFWDVQFVSNEEYVDGKYVFIFCNYYEAVATNITTNFFFFGFW